MRGAEAAARALSLVGRSEPYKLGAGDYRVTRELPFTARNGVVGSDCWGFAGAWCWMQPRHDPGFNKGPWATVSDDRNTDSAIEDSEHKREGYIAVDRPELGDLLVMPSIRDERGKRIRIGHVWIVVGVCAEWDPGEPQYHLLDTVQCQASTRPAIKRGPGPKTDARTFHGVTDKAWRIRILRPVTNSV